ncbi:MAG: glycosyltransferase family 4 protein [Desulfatibacillaceae bacterium]
MRILYICSTDLSGREASPGSVRHIMEVAENLVGLGHDVTLIAPDYAPYPHETPVRIVYVPLVNVRYARTIMYESLAPLAILREIGAHRPDAVYWRQSYLTFWPVVLARLAGVPVVTEVNGLTLDEVESEPLSSLRKRVILGLESVNYRLSSRLVCVAPSIRDRIVEHYKLPEDRATVVLNGVNADRMPVMDPREARKALGWNPDLSYVGFVGHFFPWDGIEGLIHCAPLVAERIPDVRFVVVGHGKWGEHLPALARRKKVDNRFIFTGMVPWEKLYLYVNAFDVATAPYSREINASSGRSSLKILEYFALKKPVVASRTSVIPEVIDIADRDLGLIVPPEDPPALASAIVRLLENPRLRERLGRGGREYVTRERSWPRVTEQVAKILEQAAGGSGFRHPWTAS